MTVGPKAGRADLAGPGEMRTLAQGTGFLPVPRPLVLPDVSHSAGSWISPRHQHQELRGAGGGGRGASPNTGTNLGDLSAAPFASPDEPEPLSRPECGVSRVGSGRLEGHSSKAAVATVSVLVRIEKSSKHLVHLPSAQHAGEAQALGGVGREHARREGPFG